MFTLNEEQLNKLTWTEIEWDEDLFQFKSPNEEFYLDVGTILKMDDGKIEIVGTVNRSGTYCACCSIKASNMKAFAHINQLL